MLEYKVVESSLVTDEELERIINTWVAIGWHLEGIQFAMREASKRPAMAFVLFTRRGPDTPPDGGEGATP
ncbi:MAG TPA: DUF4177 domain-containing protein [Myxococcota bacterium]|nr:DUF4177 domain-containing protein [Myxococcota bacterium]HRY92331.1 DUF4177 domain-containing protein [Myxococcota bacterium]HSA22976.1 DUF4177 domain-containing protein [Myxococcota bacterium]